MIRSRMPEVYLTLDELPPLTIALPDPNDLHVVQAAVATDGTIVTLNVNDFPAPTMASWGIEVLTPDAAFLSVASTDEEGMLTAAAQIRARLREPPISPGSYA